MRFYSLLDLTNTPASLPGFAERLNSLLTAYGEESRGKVTVERINAPSDQNAQAAAADGIRAFNTDKGDACFLGLVVASGAYKETLPFLSPDWEAALESDITRAIGRAAEAAAGGTPAPVRTDPAIVDSVKQAIPNLDSVSFEEGAKLLRQSALAELQTAAKEMEARVKEVQQKLSPQQNLPEAEQQALKQEIDKLQSEQTQRLKQIVDRSQAQLQALRQLKSQ